MKTMTTMTTWSPLRELENTQGNLFGFLGKQWPSVEWSGYSSYDWIPAIDVAEDDKEYTITADLPSVRREDIRVTSREDSLEFSGSRERLGGESGKTYHRAERAYGKFGRSFYLPDDAESGGMRAEFKEGVLTLHIPKSKSHRPSQKEIPVE